MTRRIKKCTDYCLAKDWLADDRVTICNFFDNDSFRSYLLSHYLDVELAPLINAVDLQYVLCIIDYVLRRSQERP